MKCLVMVGLEKQIKNFFIIHKSCVYIYTLYIYLCAYMCMYTEGRGEY